MYPAALDTVPVWLINGALIGVALSLLVAGLFYVLVRRLPSGRAVEGAQQSGETRRRDEVRAYLDTIDERYVEDHRVEGQQVAFYLPARDVAITFDARAYYRLDHAEPTAVLVEHELPGLALGARLPFETPEIDLEDEESTVDPREAAFAILGLSTGATHEEIRSAYRRKVKEVHPDHGGDEEAFKRLREAYATAKQDAA